MRRTSRLSFDHYQTLGVAYSATRTEIRNAFLQKAKSFHPDINPGDSSAVKKFQNVAEAHSILSSEESKKKYDQQIGNIPRVHFTGGTRTLRREQPLRAPRPATGTKTFDYQTWNEWHYGDNKGRYSRNATEQFTTHDEERRKNPHTAYFDRQNLRSQQARQEAQALHSVRHEKNDIVNRLKARRAIRTQYARNSEGESREFEQRQQYVNNSSCLIS
uniref:J domain-containing protein n=1 Tax=Aureoumbra lagunensis TaxID=44058 RepID=A0A7S3K7B5_9STRA|mmetsp:Transcript_2701/g.3693  ORF Transcript_2701/g.3693 Transcript_2701/m.3693 type:complete len:217 (+) Transcript_2701:111-761(+)